jgi:hypothetical protein
LFARSGAWFGFAPFGGLAPFDHLPGSAYQIGDIAALDEKDRLFCFVGDQVAIFFFLAHIKNFKDVFGVGPINFVGTSGFVKAVLGEVFGLYVLLDKA